MAEDQYQYDENGFREDLKGRDDVLHQPDADRTERELTTLDYDQTMAFFSDQTPAKPEYNLDEKVLDKIRTDHPKINDTDIENVIKDKYQQIMMARYNDAQDSNVTIAGGNSDSTANQKS